MYRNKDGGIANTGFVMDMQKDVPGPTVVGGKDEEENYMNGFTNGTIPQSDGQSQESDTSEPAPLLYSISEQPPFELLLFLGSQQLLVSIVGILIPPLLVAQSACAADNVEMIQMLLSTSMVINGVTTLVQNIIGIRLPVFQGTSPGYIIPLVALTATIKDRCDHVKQYEADFNINATASNISVSVMKSHLQDIRIREMIGPLLVAGGIQFLLGATGLVGLLLRFIGPVTVIPTAIMSGIYFVKVTTGFVASHWGIAFLTWALTILLAFHLGNRNMLVPVWTRKKGFHWTRYPLHRTFSVMIAIVTGWGVYAILTYYDVIKEDAQTALATMDFVTKSKWIYVPYPGQFGTPLFSVEVLVAYLIATILSIIDSVGDYYCTATVCRVPPPPKRAVNRGLAVEGFFTMIAALMGNAHGTTTHETNLGVIGMSKVASRSVFVVQGILFIVCGVLAKFCAFFTIMPYPVLGGSLVLVCGAFIGLTLCNMRVMDMSSTRNFVIIGMGIFMGLMVPQWVQENGTAIQTGVTVLDDIIISMMSNPNFFAGFVSCLLDNTIPGTLEERGIAAWINRPSKFSSNGDLLEGEEVYNIPSCGVLDRLFGCCHRNGYNVNTTTTTTPTTATQRSHSQAPVDDSTGQNTHGKY